MRENIRIHGIPEIGDNKDDDLETLLNIAQETNIHLKENDI